MKKQLLKSFTAFLIGVSFSYSCFSDTTAIVVHGLEETSLSETDIDLSGTLNLDITSPDSIMPDSGISLEYNEDSYNYYDQLNANNKRAYDEMTVWLDPQKTCSEVSISLAEPIEFTVSTIDTSKWDDETDEAFWSLISDALYDAINALTFDRPDFFWLDTAKIGVGVGEVQYKRNIFTRKYTMVVSSISVIGAIHEELGSADDVEVEIEAMKDAAADFAVTGDDRFEKLKYIHDKIGKTAVYNESGTFAHISYGAFFEPYEIVCEGYSKAVKLLCDMEGIPCVIVPGNVDTTLKIGHAWNYVQMEDGKWYGLDVTWDDLDSVITPVKYQYFLKGSESFNKNHTNDSTYSCRFEYPELSKSDYVYNQGSTELVVLPGDFNNDGILSSADYILLMKKLVKLEEINDADVNHDLDGNGIINIFDAIFLKRYIRG